MVEAARDVSYKCEEICERLKRLQPRLGGLVILGERALRYWVLKEIFEDALGWPSMNIVVGEKFDALLLDSRQSPVIYLETKSLGRGAPVVELEQAKTRFSTVHSLELMVFTDVLEWSTLTKSGKTTRWSPGQSEAPYFGSLDFRRFSG